MQVEDAPDLLADVRAALEEGRPSALLGFASSVLAVFDERNLDPFEQESPGGSLDELIDMLLDVELPETSALVLAIATLLPDDLATRRLRRVVEQRRDVLPSLTNDLDEVEVAQPVVMGHVLGDGENLVLPVSIVGDEVTVVAYIDHNMGTLVKDAFVLEGSGDEAIEGFRTAAADDPDTTFTTIDRADARARITGAIELAAMTHPAFESETWPACRAFVEWVVARLPGGGSGHVRPVWSEAEVQSLTDRFLASPHGRAHDNDLARDQLEWILWFGTDYGPSDPLRWSTVKVELLLLDWLPRKVMVEPDQLTGVPDVLSDLIRFVHEDMGIRSKLTDETLAGLDRHARDYQRIIRDEDRPRGPHALVAALGSIPGFLEGGPGWLDDMGGLDLFEDDDQWLLGMLAVEVGGPDALEELDAVPLPDDPFDRTVLVGRRDATERVEDIVSLLDGACGELFDVEHRTACRRLLADLVAVDAALLLRGRAETAAGAVLWLIGKGNDSFEGHTGGLTVGEVLAWLGVSGSVSKRARTMLATLDLGDPDTFAYQPVLGTSRYLTGQRRQRLVELRDGLQTTS